MSTRARGRGQGGMGDVAGGFGAAIKDAPRALTLSANGTFTSTEKPLKPNYRSPNVHGTIAKKFPVGPWSRLHVTLKLMKTTYKAKETATAANCTNNFEKEDNERGKPQNPERLHTDADPQETENRQSTTTPKGNNPVNSHTPIPVATAMKSATPHDQESRRRNCSPSAWLQGSHHRRSPKPLGAFSVRYRTPRSGRKLRGAGEKEYPTRTS
mmetsp:Transcript_54874/g.119499  ORF Transcript_54874/g.119499 Transcript_54874/m.119499 type:complete len:212 (-) Transcript_54874:400-1035(-)